MVDAGVLLGLVGIGVALGSLVYARVQASAAKGQALEARRQAEQATHMTVLAANQHLFERLKTSREKLGSSPHLLGEMKATSGPLFIAVEQAGGWDDYMTLREVMEVFQETYFLRADGLVTEPSWKFMSGNVQVWTRLPSFVVAFEAAVDHRLLHPEFVAAMRQVLAGESLRDPGQDAVRPRPLAAA